MILPGWFCTALYGAKPCGTFNGEAKELHETCRACGSPRGSARMLQESASVTATVTSAQLLDWIEQIERVAEAASFVGHDGNGGDKYVAGKLSWLAQAMRIVYLKQLHDEVREETRK